MVNVVELSKGVTLTYTNEAMMRLTIFALNLIILVCLVALVLLVREIVLIIKQWKRQQRAKRRQEARREGRVQHVPML